MHKEIGEDYESTYRYKDGNLVEKRTEREKTVVLESYTYEKDKLHSEIQSLSPVNGPVMSTTQNLYKYDDLGRIKLEIQQLSPFDDPWYIHYHYYKKEDLPKFSDFYP